jgi:hypothetical protein
VSLPLPFDPLSVPFAAFSVGFLLPAIAAMLVGVGGEVERGEVVSLGVRGVKVNMWGSSLFVFYGCEFMSLASTPYKYLTLLWTCTYQILNLSPDISE